MNTQPVSIMVKIKQGIHIIKRNDASYETYMAKRRKTVMWTYVTEATYRPTKTYSKTMVEPSFQMRVVSYETLLPQCERHSIQGYLTGRGLARPSWQNARRPAVTHSDQMTWTKCAMSTLSGFDCADSTSGLNKMHVNGCRTKRFCAMWMSYWYNDIQNIVSYDIVLYKNVNALKLVRHYGYECYIMNQTSSFL